MRQRCQKILFLLLLDINRKRLNFSSEDNSFISLLFACLVLLGFTKNSTNYMRGLYVYIKVIVPPAMIEFCGSKA